MNFSAIVLYDDAACTQRVVQVDAPSPPRFAQEDYQDGSGVYASITRAVFNVGAAVPPVPLYLTNNGGPCVLANTDASETFYQVGAQVDVDAVLARLDDRIE
jgi:hypothetical protein